MVSVVILDKGEPNVIQLTFELLYKELKDIPGSELLIREQWGVTDVRNRYVCFVEPDCLVSEGFFKKQLEAFDLLSPRVVALGHATAVKYWPNKIYGYCLSPDYEATVMPIRKAKTSRPYPVQIAFIPGTIIRTSSLKRILKKLTISHLEEDLVYYSSLVSLGIWNSGITTDAKHPLGQLGTQVYINPNAIYCTTEDYVNDMGQYEEPMEGNLISLFSRESV